MCVISDTHDDEDDVFADDDDELDEYNDWR